jgi:hypothetical protein
MANSKFEKFNQRILKDIIVRLYKLLLEDGEENPKFYNISDDGVFKSIETITKLMGVGDGEYEDIDFIYALYSLNYHLINDGKIEGDITIPILEKYSFDVDVRETVYQTVTYRHIESSYSEKNAVPIFQRADYDGNFSVYDGNPIHTEIYDSETNDISWDYKSVRKLKSK